MARRDRATSRENVDDDDDDADDEEFDEDDDIAPGDDDEFSYDDLLESMPMSDIDIIDAPFEKYDIRGIEFKSLKPHEMRIIWNAFSDLNSFKQITTIASEVLQSIVASKSIVFTRKKCQCDADVDVFTSDLEFPVACIDCMKACLAENGYSKDDVEIMSGSAIQSTYQAIIKVNSAAPAIPETPSPRPDTSPDMPARQQSDDMIKDIVAIATTFRTEAITLIEKNASRNKIKEGKVTKQDLIDALIVEFINYIASKTGAKSILGIASKEQSKKN